MQTKNSAGIPPRANTRVRTPTVLQMELVECGAACLAMICAYHRKYIPLEELRIACGVTKDGVRAGNIVKAATRLGFVAKGFRKEPADLAAMPVPMVLHWNFNHFVVFEGFRRGRAYINDPASGHRVLTLAELDAAFTGVVLTFEPGADFTRAGRPTTLASSLKKRLRGVRSALVFLLAVGLLLVVPGIVIPAFTRIFIDDLLLAGRTEWLRPLLWCMAATALLQALLTALQRRYLLRMETKIALLGASSFLWHVLRLPVVFFQQRMPGDISLRMGGNDAVAAFLSRELAENLIRACSLLFYLLVMLRYSASLTGISVGLAMAGVLYFLYASGRVEELNSKLAQDAGNLYNTTVSGLHIIETIKATGAEPGFFAKWAGQHAKQLNGQQRIGGYENLLYTLPTLTTGLAEAAVLCVGGLLILRGRMTVGSLVAFQGLLASFLYPVHRLTRMGMQIKQLKGDMARLDDVHQYPVDVAPAPGDAPDAATPGGDAFRKLDGYVELVDLTFGYNRLDAPLLRGFSLALRPGDRVALVGTSGSGKSTVARLIAGVIRPWEGAIRFDRTAREELPRSVVCGSVAVVDQEIRLFEGTVMENLTMWDDTVDEHDVLQATRDACIHDDIVRRAGGYTGPVAEDGANFSGGQRQRLEIARALALNPSILVLDEATSALDATTEQRINENIRRRGCTCVIVAHRLSTIRDCDEIIVMHGGQIVQRGSHDHLYHAPGLYAELVRNRF